MIDVRSGNPLLYLPLDKLVQQGGGPGSLQVEPSGTGAARAPAVESAPVLNPEVRSRDAQRNRDREVR